MNDKITDEWLKTESLEQSLVSSNGEFTGKYTRAIVRQLLLERAERAKNPGVWDGAPEDATRAQIKWFVPMTKEIYSEVLKRELPKTRAREFAEARAKTEISIPDTEVQLDVNELADVIESAIIKYEEGK